MKMMLKTFFFFKTVPAPDLWEEERVGGRAGTGLWASETCSRGHTHIEDFPDSGNTWPGLLVVTSAL